MDCAAAQVLEQFNSAFITFLNPLTPQEERSAIGNIEVLGFIYRSSICKL